MPANALAIYCKRIGAQLTYSDDVSVSDIFQNINSYIADDYFKYKVNSFVCTKISELPDVFIVENKADDFGVYERVVDGFCCISNNPPKEDYSFLGKKIIILRSYPKSLDALVIYNLIRKKVPKASMLFIPLVVFSLLIPFYSNIFNSRLVYSSSLTSVLYITILFVFFVLLEMFLRIAVYKSVERMNVKNSVMLNNFIVYILSVTSDKTALSTSRTIETSASLYWKASSTAIVDISLLVAFFICMVFMLGEYSFLLSLYYIIFSFFCVYSRFESYQKAIKKIGLVGEKIIEHFSLHSNRAQTLYSNFDTLRHELFIRDNVSEGLNGSLNLHNHQWAEILKLNSFISMAVMYIACYLSVSDGNLPVSAIIAVMIINSRLSSAITALVGNVYNIRMNLYQVKSGLLKLMDKNECRGGDKVYVSHIDCLCLENITIEPHGRATLSSYNAKFYTGDVVTVLGSVGAGKSTLLRCIVGKNELQHGVIRYNKINAYNIDILTYQKEVAFYDTSFRFFHGSLRFNFNLYGVYESDRILEIIHDCCPKLNVDSAFLDEMNADDLFFSAGEKQKLIISMILEKKPSLIVLDEPTAFMQGNEGLVFIRRLVERHRGAIFFIATHDSMLKQIGNKSIHIKQEMMPKKIFINTPAVGA